MFANVQITPLPGRKWQRRPKSKDSDVEDTISRIYFLFNRLYKWERKSPYFAFVVWLEREFFIFRNDINGYKRERKDT